MFCPKCGKGIADTANVCGYCGFKIPAKVESLPEVKKPRIKQSPAKAASPAIQRRRLPVWAWGLIGLVIVLLALGGGMGLYLNQKYQQPIWGAQYRAAQDFGPGYWSAGEHEYAFKAVADTGDCSIEPFEGEPVTFYVAEDVPYTSKVYLRIYGIYATALAEDAFFTINPQQATIPVITFLQDDENGIGFTHAEAKTQLAACTLYFRWDDHPWQPLEVEQVVEFTP
ncbi:MAG: zinc ribbon domain-containing protein [Chloroflexota bacterium]